MIRGERACLSALVLVVSACLEPNPNADAETGADEVDATSGESGSETGTGSAGETTSDTSDTTSDETGMPCDPCGLGFEVLEFEAGPDDFVGEVPKPDFAHTAPIAFVREYLPGNADELGYAITWTDAGASWQVEVALLDAAPNSRVRGVALVLGSDEAPTIHELEAGMGECAGAPFEPANDRRMFESVERYDPAGGAVLAFAKQFSDTLDYCVTAADSPEATIGAKLVELTIPPGVVVAGTPDVVLDMATGGSAYFSEGDPTWAMIHLVGLREFDDQAASDLGYTIACSTGSMPFPCDFEFDGFSAGARAVLGGDLLAIP